LDWIPYSELKFTYSTSLGDGKKKIYARFKDIANNITEPIFKEITIDSEPPRKPLISINNGAIYTKNEIVNLRLYGDDAVEMRLRSYNQFDEKLEWIPFQDTLQWELKPEESTQFVYGQFKDAAGNISLVVNSSITVDKEPPSKVSFQIREEKYCTRADREVTLVLHALNASKVMVSNNSDFDNGFWQVYKPEVSWQLSNGDGEKTIFVQFADNANNITETLTDSITLDRQAPIGSIVANDGMVKTAKVDVALSINSEDAHQMMFSPHPGFPRPAAWEPFETTRLWRDSGAEGEKMIYFKLRDDAGNISDPIATKVILDMQAPVFKYFEINTPKDDDKREYKQSKLEGMTDVTLYTIAENADYMRVANTADELKEAEWEPYFGEKEWKLPPKIVAIPVAGFKDEGEVKKVFIQFKDEIGNESKVFSTQIILY